MLVLPEPTSYLGALQPQPTLAPSLQGLPRLPAPTYWRAELVLGAACTSGALPWHMGTLRCMAGTRTCPR